MSGTLETAGDRDWFALDLRKYHGYLFTPLMANGQVPTLTIWNGDTGKVVYTTEPGGLYNNTLRNPFVPAVNANYYAEISGDHLGAYTLGMREAPDDAGNDPASARPLAVGAPAAGRFDYAFDKDQFRIAAVAGMTYTVTITADRGSVGTTSFFGLTLEENGVFSGYQASSSLIWGFTAARTGDYLITADLASQFPLPGGGVDYQVSVTARDLAIPQVVRAAGTVDGAIVLTMDEAVRMGDGGVIRLRPQSGPDLDSWRPGDPRVHISGNTVTLTLDRTGVLEPGKYDLEIEGDALTDASGNKGAGIYNGMVDVRGTAQGGLALISQDMFGHVRGPAGAEDALVLSGTREMYTIVRDGEHFKVSWNEIASNTVSGIERIMFTHSDEVIALSLDGKLGQAFRLYTAAFDRAPDETGLGFWLNVAQRGVSLPEMARGFIASKEFADLYGVQPTDAAFVAALYQNVLHRPGEADGVRFWNDALGRGVDRGEVLAAFSESRENQEQVVELIGNGIEYTPWG
ncbi:DUF4214 domain-containing protein [Telluria beijingensis]|uniref:DUF4214 domain-containing protein n=1 Tax=Telluria beijingensis TaxID=3068633 RepID=UPI002796215D|nr:DUF4214 domain-containing protein [Massilia sp. REN29]